MKVFKIKSNSFNIKGLQNFQSDIDEIEQEISNLESIIKNPELLEIKEDDSEIIEERDKNIEFKRRSAKKREWDKPKLSLFSLDYHEKVD